MPISSTFELSADSAPRRRSIQLLKFMPLRSFFPIANDFVSAGFPSPAENYLDTAIDLNEELILNPSSTFFLRVSGESMTGEGIQNNDILIVDRSIDPKPGNIVIAILDGEFTVKRLAYHQGSPYLEAAHPSYPPIDFSKYGDIQIWGVAIYSIHNLKPNKK